MNAALTTTAPGGVAPHQSRVARILASDNIAQAAHDLAVLLASDDHQVVWLVTRGVVEEIAHGADPHRAEGIYERADWLLRTHQVRPAAVSTTPAGVAVAVAS